jgi:hypothetical protein
MTERRVELQRPHAKRPSPTKLRPEAQSQEARRVAAVVLEVLGGSRTPTDAAAALSVSLPRYYALETRALEGLLEACERRSRGPRRSAEREIGRLRREVARLERESARSQALFRVAHRALGLRPPERPGPSKGKRRRRQPVVRALRAAALIRPAGAAPENTAQGGGTDAAART